MLINIRKAYFNAKTSDDEPIYVELPRKAEATPGMCALLRRHMCGTCMPAEGWQDESNSSPTEAGFVQGMASPCLFNNPSKGIAVFVHGDDFIAVGPKPELD